MAETKDLVVTLRADTSRFVEQLREVGAALTECADRIARATEED